MILSLMKHHSTGRIPMKLKKFKKLYGQTSRRRLTYGPNDTYSKTFGNDDIMA